MRRFFSSIRVRLLLLVLFAILPTLGLTLYTGLEHRRMAAAQAKHETLMLAWAAAENQGRLTAGAQQIALTLAQLPQVRGASPADCSAFLADLLQQYPGYGNLGVAELNGDLRCSALPASGPVNYADRDWLQRALQARDFVVGSYVIGRITGTPLLPFARPILDENGRMQAVFYGGIDLTWFEQFVAEVQLPPGATFTMVDRNGVILARYPGPERWLGQAMPEASIVKIILDQQEEGAIEATGLDGVRRLYAFTPLTGATQNPDAYVAVGIPTAVAFAEPNRLLTRNLATLGFVTLLALAVAWVGSEISILRRVKGLLRATGRLAAGDLRARTGQFYGVGELSQLARAFDQMAESLQQRIAERTQAEAALLEQAAALGEVNAALKSSEERFRSFIENSLDIVAVLTADGTISYESPSVERVLGYKPEELVSTNALELVHPDDIPLVASTLAQIMQPGVVKTLELRYRHKDGSWRQLDGVGKSVIGPMGDVSIIANIRDITERKRAEAARQITSEVLDALNAEPDAVEAFPRVAADLKRLTGCDRLSLTLFDERREWASVVALDQPHPELGQGVQLRLADTAAAETAAAETVLAGRIHLTPDLAAEAYFPVERVLYEAGYRSRLNLPLRVEERILGELSLAWLQPAGYAMTQLPVLAQIADAVALAVEKSRLLNETRRQAARAEALVRVAARLNAQLDLRAVLDAVCEETAQALSVPAVCVFLCDEQRQKLIIAALTGLPAKYQTDYVPTPLTRYEEHVRKLGPTIVVPDVQAEPGLPNHALYAEMDVRTAASASLLHERQFIGTLTALTIGRERRFSGDDLALLQGLADQAVMAIVNARLYAAQRGINAQLQMALRAKDEMIQNVSHELRTPLALMHGYAELMEAEGLGPLTAEQQRAASVMLAQGKRLRFMVDRLLTLQSFSADKLNRGALELGPWLSQVMEAWSYRAADKGFRFEVDAPPDLPPVNADSNYLNEVIENLADNAVKFSPQGGVVRISAWATEGEVVVAVADEGIGIDPEDLPRLFERFYQVDGSTTRMYGGMGIGLALCQAIVDAHGGRIWAESAGKGQGSTFFIALPVCERS